MGLTAVGFQRDEASQLTPDQLIVRSIPAADPGDLLAILPAADSLAWVQRGEGLAAWGTTARITLPAGHDRFEAGQKWLTELFQSADVADEVGVPGSGPVAFGSFTFDPASEGSVLVVPRVVLGRRHGRAWLTTINAAGAPPAEPAETAPVIAPGRVRWSDGSQSAPQWEQAVAAAVARIEDGELSKVVLARDLNATAEREIDARVLLARLSASYPDCYSYSVAGLVGATPELLVRREGTAVHSLVLAGTTPRGGTTAADAALGAALLESAKDRNEHAFAVADVSGTLQPLCSSLSVAPEPALLRLANVQHLATQISGELASGQLAKGSALALAAALHPTAAVGGTPAEAALELIRELEGMDRGRYSGPVGWVDAAGNGEWGIALRCGLIEGRRARIFAGCGIVAGSQPALELAEAQAKFRPMCQALEA